MHKKFNFVIILFMFLENGQHSNGFASGLFKNHIGNSILPEQPSPFGVLERNYPRNKSLDCACGLSKLGQLANDVTNWTEEISATDVPWLVLIYLKEKTEDTSTSIGNPSKICSGAIINDRMILTVASCLVNISDGDDIIRSLLAADEYTPNPEDVVVLMATGDKIILSNDTTFTQLEVEKVTCNPYYGYQKILRGKHDWDIAFIQLQTPLEFNKDFVPLCIANKFLDENDLEGTGVFSFGWETLIEHTSGVGKVIYSLNRYSISHIHTRMRCRAISGREWISERFLCTDGPPFLEAKFLETPGSPVVIQSTNDPYLFTQYGIYSLDIVGLLMHKKNVRVLSNVSGFLEMIDNFADYVKAQWCSRDEPQAVPKRSDWGGGKELNEEFTLEKVAVSEWNSTTSEQRQYLPFRTCQCGYNNFQGQQGARIFGGVGVTWNKYPWQVQLIARFDQFKQPKNCSGTIINDKLILTSATCVHRIEKPKLNKMRSLGKILDLVKPERLEIILAKPTGFGPENGNAIKVAVHMVVPHVNFKGNLCNASLHDIALIVLKDRLDFPKLNKRVSPICLPESSDSFLIKDGHKDAIVTGWGKISETDQAKYLQELHFEIFSREKCNTLWHNAYNLAYEAFHISDCVKNRFEMGSFCGGTSLAEYVGPASGDYGGPVMLQANITLNMVQVGYVSLVSYDLMKQIEQKLRSNSGNQKSFHLNDTAIVIYNEIQPLLPFIDYFSLVVDAKWCPRKARKDI